MNYKCNLGGTSNCVASEAECSECTNQNKQICPNCGETDAVREQVTARAVIIKMVNLPSNPMVVSYDPTGHLFYECGECGRRW